MPDLPSNQDPQCTEIIQSILLIIWPIVILLVATFLIYGIYLTVTLLAVYVLLSRGIRNSRPRLVLFIITVLELLVSTAYVVVVTLVVNALLFHYGLSPGWTQHYLRLSQQAYAGTDVVMRLNTRQIYFDLLHARNFRVGGPATRNLLTSLPLLITNVLATALVGYKTWSHRKALKQNLMSTGTYTSKALKTLWLLIESGLVYCVIWMAFIIVTETGPTPNDAYATPSALIFANIIPLLAVGVFIILPFSLSKMLSHIILVAALEDTKKPDNNLSPDGNNISGSLSQSIRFASENAAANVNNVSMTRSGGVLEVDLHNRGVTFVPSPSADDMELPTKNEL
ncbi:hypothetical protein K435DRAFT_804178 [Dendrothele bispora CBS 962.96]|uniref:Uncharacterized protein n=1 Tax=Dendrothele bispora (strain CBS 962.96) TaxID=1314807 RepID=A0A4S8LF23_DENBC|nr:hypothetical protein K435DRAFT_804178 [Dendrothele bispora CBS 962.96]